MLADTYNVSSMLAADYGPLEQLGELESRVYRGRGNDGRYVALRFSTIQSAAARTALIEMAGAASSVQHPMLAAVGGCQSFSGGTLCIVSEYVPGKPLDRWLDENGPPTLQIAIDLVRRLCLGVHAAHQRGLMHPALRPSNLMVLQPDTQPDGRIVAKLLDLGAPAFLHAWPPRVRDLPFVAPELRSALDPIGSPITAAMNVYSCGAILHYLCTGEAPPSAAGELELPEELTCILQNALCSDPGERTPNPAELAAALGQLESSFRTSGVYRRDAARRSQSLPRVAANTGVARVPPPPTGSYPSLKLPPPQRWVVAGALAGLLALYAGWVLWTTASSRTRQVAQQPSAAPMLPPEAPAPVRAAPTVPPPAPPIPAGPPAPEVPQPAPRVHPRRPKPAEAAPTPTLPAGVDTQPPAAAPAAEPPPSEAVVAPPPTEPAPPAPAPVPIVAPKPVAVEAESPKPQPAPSPRQLQIADMTVRGSLAVSVVRRAIERIRPLMLQCYERHVAPGQPAPAPLTVSATIDEVGRVRNPSVEGGALPALNACLVKATAKIDADAPDTGIVKASWTLRF